MIKKYVFTFFTIFFLQFFLFGQNITEGLQAHYEFDQTLLDGTENDNDLNTSDGTISYELTTVNDYAISFDGNSQTSTISSFDNSSFTEIAVSLWVKSNTTTSNLQICLQGAYMGFGAYIQANSGKFIGFFDSSSSGSYESTNAITDGLWHHIVIQNNGTTTYMYVDGVLDGSISENLVVGNGTSTNKLYLGKSNLGVQNFTGSLNDVRIYNRMLTQCDIDALYGIKKLPVASFLFENNLIDSVNDNDLSSGSSISYETFSTGDTAIVFDGNSQVSSIASFDNTSFTKAAISLWIKSSTVTSDLQICLQGAYMGFGAYIQANSGKFIGFFDSSSSGSYESTNAITDGIWHHVVIQNDGTTTYMYIDGVLDGSINENFVVGNGTSTNKLYLGKSNQGVQNFTGSLNNIHIYDRILSICEIEEMSQVLSVVEHTDSKQINFSIYPNPTNGVFLIDLKDRYAKVNLQIFDITGKLIKEEHYSQTQLVTSKLEVAKGIYIVKVFIGNNNPFVSKLIKK
ncbi:LamG-like jellyroll fold domain-containing protein [Kordia sp.]|uniref:LamG domain-containing protein n=1 Tax=Kordia sp. TaxID=1965332 RepID=UPI003B5AD85D